MKTTIHPSPAIVTPAQWLAARRELLHHEKEITRLRDELAARRRELPWVQVTRDYRFDSAAGPVSLAELFAGRGQLIIQHFMLGCGWEEGCKSCSFMLDHLAATVVHLAARDVAFAVVSRAPLAEILPFQRRMGWNVNWVSAHATGFNEDFHVSFDAEETAQGEVFYNYSRRPFPFEEAPGISVFARGPDGTVYHTYSTYGRGVEVAMGTYPLLDLVPKGRDESGLEYGMEWVRHHDRYEHVLAHS
jgi:predicted dithiol-disulfide oxidoreductase (DUF899 family)